MPHAVLDSLISKREEAIAKSEAITTRALEDDRVTDSELSEAETTELGSLKTRIETLDRSIGQWQSIAETEDRVEQARQRLPVRTQQVGGAVVTRDESVYRLDGQRSWFADLFHARAGDSECREVMERDLQQRALTTGITAPGGGNIVPPAYIAALFAPDAKFGAPVAASWPQYPLSDARAFKVPRQTGHVTVSDQASENTPITPTDPTFDQITITPATAVGATVFSRQLLDGSVPAIDQIIASDLRGELLLRGDSRATSTMVATTGAGTDTSSGDAEDLLDAIVAALPTVYAARKMPADTIYLSPSTYGYLSSAKDTTGRPLLFAVNPQNSYGVGVVGDLTAVIGGVPCVVAPQLADNKVVVARRSDFGFFTSPALQVRYEEKYGPESIEIAIWQYQAAMTGRYPTSVFILTHTPA